MNTQLGKNLWKAAEKVRGLMNADQFQPYFLTLVFYRFLSDNYQAAAKKELGRDYPASKENDKRTPLAIWYEENLEDVQLFESQMLKKIFYTIRPQYLWERVADLSQTHGADLISTLQEVFKYVEDRSFDGFLHGLFAEINLKHSKLGNNDEERNKKICAVIQAIDECVNMFGQDVDCLGDAYEFLIGKFAQNSWNKDGCFYTPKSVSDILASIVTLDSHDPSKGEKQKIERVLDFACGSGSLLLNVCKKMKDAGGVIGKIYGQEKSPKNYNLARMNMLAHGLKEAEYDLHHGDTLVNDWGIFNEINHCKKIKFDAIVSSPPMSCRWTRPEEMAQDFRFKDYGLAPISSADFAFALHGLHFLSEEGTMAIVLPHGGWFRGGAEEKIRRKLLEDGNIDAIIALPANLFFSTGIPVYIVVLKKCKRFDDVLFINAVDYFEKGGRQNTLSQEHMDKIIETYKERKEQKRYSRRVSMDEIVKNECNLLPTFSYC